MQALQLSHETNHQQIDREFAEKIRPFEEKRRVLLGQRNSALAAKLKPDQLAAERKTLELQYNAVVPGRPYSDRESLKEPIYNLELLEDEARAAAKHAAAELLRIDGELAGIQNSLNQIEEQTFRRHRVRLLANIIPAAVEFVRRQEELNDLDAAGRAHGYQLSPLGVAMAQHPAATRTSRNSDEVQAYLQFLLASLDPQFAESLGEDHPARRKFRAAQQGAGISGLGLLWG